MAFQLSVAVRNARLDAIETVTGTTAHLQLRSGAQPANCAAAATGTLIADLTLPSDYLAAASGGTKAKAGTWSGTAAVAGTAIGHCRLVDSAGTTCHGQGSVTITGGGGDVTVDDLTPGSVGQVITVNSFTLTDGNA